MSDLEAMPDATWHTLLLDVLVQYVTLLTNPEGPAPSAPTLTRKQTIERDTARKEASTATAASAAAAVADGGGDSGDGGGAPSCHSSISGNYIGYYIVVFPGIKLKKPGKFENSQV